MKLDTVIKLVQVGCSPFLLSVFHRSISFVKIQNLGKRFPLVRSNTEFLIPWLQFDLVFLGSSAQQ